MIAQQDILREIYNSAASIKAKINEINDARTKHNVKLGYLEDLLEKHPGIPEYFQAHELSGFYAQMNPAQYEAGRILFDTYVNLYIRYLAALREYSFTARDILVIQDEMKELLSSVRIAIYGKQKTTECTDDDLLFAMDIEKASDNDNAKQKPVISQQQVQRLTAISTWLQVNQELFKQILLELDGAMNRMTLECEEDERFEKLLFLKIRQLPDLKKWVGPWINDHDLEIEDQAQPELTALKEAISTLPEKDQQAISQISYLIK